MKSKMAAKMAATFDGVTGPHLVEKMTGFLLPLPLYHDGGYEFAYMSEG